MWILTNACQVPIRWRREFVVSKTVIVSNGNRKKPRDRSRWLADAGASTELSPLDAFIAAAAAGDVAVARERLTRHPNLFEALTDRDRGELCEAAAAGNLAGVRAMLDLGWDVNTRNVVWNETPTHRAAMHGHLDLVRLLVDRGADLNSVNNTSPPSITEVSSEGFTSPAISPWLLLIPESQLAAGWQVLGSLSRSSACPT